MCGIFGIIAKENTQLSGQMTHDIIEKLFVLSESRGKESAGIAIKNPITQTISVLKKDIPASDLIKGKEYKDFYNKATEGIFSKNKHQAFGIIAHSRLVTNGSELNNNNNQPVIKDGGVIIHNGICTNIDILWDKFEELEREFVVDTEILVSLIRKYKKEGQSLVNSTKEMFSKMEGAASIALLQEDTDLFVLATNNGSLYFSFNTKNDILLFASESYILNKLVEELQLEKILGSPKSTWMGSKAGFVLNNYTFEKQSFDDLEIKEDSQTKKTSSSLKYKLHNYSPGEVIKSFEPIAYNTQADKKRKGKLQFNLEAINHLKRCKKCLLLETFPFIEYDENGVCNICNHYVPKSQGKKEEEFIDIMEQYRNRKGMPDCIVPFSGGRDSSFSLHYIVNELKMKPITYTYDWGMVTDLARRNIARVCGKLGLENILISADIKQKRRNIQLNVEAWLKQPELGIIPLFMAGDKQFFSYVNKVKRETGIIMDIWSMNRLENTDFKAGFCGIKLNFDKKRIDYLSLGNQLTMGAYYARNFIQNPSYINASVIDTVKSFLAYYNEPRTHYYQIFDYIPWDEKTIENTLFNEYNWEISSDTTTTWRIGDGTASFYNYIYYTVAGFSEFDTFRSNQIREGMLSREEGLRLINQENRPRYESMKWYLDTINVDFDKAIEVINQIPKLYKVQ